MYSTRPAKEDRTLIEIAINEAVDVMPLVIGGDSERAMHLLHTDNKKEE